MPTSSEWSLPSRFFDHNFFICISHFSHAFLILFQLPILYYYYYYYISTYFCFYLLLPWTQYGYTSIFPWTLPALFDCHFASACIASGRRGNCWLNPFQWHISTWSKHASSWLLIDCNLISEVLHLSAEPDFRDVTLRWEYDRHAPKLYGFHVHYCELQAWGPNRCRFKVQRFLSTS